MKPDLHKIYEQTYRRGSIIEDVAAIEEMMNAFFSYHYLKRHDSEFVADFLENQYMSFQLKKDLIHRILKSHYPEFNAGSLDKGLEKMQRVRNIIAHGIRRVDVSNMGGEEQRIGDPYFVLRGEKSYMHDLEKEFSGNEDIVLSVLEQLPGVIGYLKKNRAFNDVDVSFTERARISIGLEPNEQTSSHSDIPQKQPEESDQG